MSWAERLKKPLLSLNPPDGWVIQLGPDEAFRRDEGEWVEMDPAYTDGRFLEEDEIKIVPAIASLAVIIYFIPNTMLAVTEELGAELHRHITITLRPYYKARDEEDAVSRFWKEYGTLVALIENLGFELRDQDVDDLGEERPGYYFVDTSFWTFPGEEDVQDFLKKIITQFSSFNPAEED